MKDDTLTKVELVAKAHFLKLIEEANRIPCDISLSSMEWELPKWFDEEKYNRGRDFFQNNRFGISKTQLIGLVCLLAETKGLNVLSGSGRSSTPETARKRYVSTVLHTLSWHDVILSPGSKSWESLKKVRRMHYFASKGAEKKNFGFISQSELATTAFGFMGFVLIRPKMFGIRYKNREDLEGFVHLWGCVCHMLGIHDEYNICLLELDALKILCQMFVRYLFMPIIQIETNEFKQMVEAVIDGLKQFIKFLQYKTHMFNVKRALGIPGYQFPNDINEVIPCRDILSSDDIEKCRIAFEKYEHEYNIDYNLSTKILLYEFYDNENCENNNNNYIPENLVRLQKFLQRKTGKNVRIKIIENEIEFRNSLNDSKLYELTYEERKIIFSENYLSTIYEYKLGRIIIELINSFFIYLMRKYYENLK